MEPARPRFAIDGMAVRSGRYLRILGYDAVWDVALPTRALARLAAAEGRVLVTRNRHLGEQFHASGPVLRLASEDPVLQLRQAIDAFGLDASRAFTRCTACNTLLERADRAQVAARVPEGVLRAGLALWTCASCARVYWRGGHVARTCARVGIPLPPDAPA